MDKQEIIERLNNKLSETLKFQQIFEPLSEGHSGCESRANAFMTAINYVEQLDEPQKVKVPAFVAEWIKLCKEKADVSSCLNGYYEIGNGTIVRPRGFSEEFYDWLADCDHMHDLARAWIDGYEVEEEQKWVVKSNRLYFIGITQLIAREPITYNFTTDEKRAHVFDDKESAEKEASFFDGTVEKTEE